MCDGCRRCAGLPRIASLIVQQFPPGLHQPNLGRISIREAIGRPSALRHNDESRRSSRMGGLFTRSGRGIRQAAVHAYPAAHRPGKKAARRLHQLQVDTQGRAKYIDTGQPDRLIFLLRTYGWREQASPGVFARRCSARCMAPSIDTDQQTLFIQTLASQGMPPSPRVASTYTHPPEQVLPHFCRHHRHM